MKLAMSRKNLWEKTPVSVKSVLVQLATFMPLQCLLGAAFRKHLRFLSESQWWSADRIQDYQMKELRRICGIAWEKTAYYRRIFSAAGFEPGGLESFEDFRRIPTIDRRTIRENLGEMCARSIRSHKVDYVSTGGTGGIPLHFYIGSDRSAIEYAYLISGWQRAGYGIGMPMAVFRGRVVPADKTGLRHEYDPVFRHHYYSNFHMNEENMRRYLENIRGIGPCVLHVYPSAITALARFARASNIEPPRNIRGILAESEVFYPDQRAIVEDTFRCKCFSSYGMTEKVVAAAECEHSSDYHVWPTYGYFELLDDEGRPVRTPGQRGEIVGTGFINTVVPFIRYRTGDYATYAGDRCVACGREHPIVRDIRGHRIQEFLVACDGSRISWAAVNLHDDAFQNVLRFQFRQLAPGNAILRLIPAKGFDGQDRNRIVQSLARKFEDRLSFEIEVVDSIASSERGKAIYVDQRIEGLKERDDL